MPRFENCASTCANHTARSAGQKGGIFTEMAETIAAPCSGGCGTGASGGGSRACLLIAIVGVTNAAEGVFYTQCKKQFDQTMNSKGQKLFKNSRQTKTYKNLS